MARYNCGFEAPENNNDEIKAKIVKFWDEREMIGWYFDNELVSAGEVDDMSFENDMQDLSNELPDVLVWLDIYLGGTDIYRMYALSGKIQFADSIIDFAKPNTTDWV